MPSHASEVATVIRLRRLAAAKAFAASIRPYWISRSTSRVNGGMSVTGCRGAQARPSQENPGSTIVTRSGATSAVPTASATSVTILKPTQRPEYRDSSKPRRPMSRMSWVLPGKRLVALERQVEAAEGRAAVAGDQRRGVEAAPPVRAVLVERQPDEGLDARKEDPALFAAILRVQRGQALHS